MGWVLSALALLMVLSLYLAWNRFLTVDDFQNVYMARIMGMGRQRQFFANGEFHLILLGWALRLLSSSVDILHASRLAFGVWFWVNLILMVRALGYRVRSRDGAVALLAVATLAPLWLHGYEIRHDNLLVTWILVFWTLVCRPVRSRGGMGYAVTGALTVIVQLCDFKSFAYWIPCTGLALAFPNPVHTASRSRLLRAWLGGVGLGLLIAVPVYFFSGSVDFLWRGVGLLARDVASTPRFGPGVALGLLCEQAPGLVAAFVAFLALCVGRFRERGVAFLSWETWTPEAVFALLGVGMLLVNPNPYPYNLLLLVPQLVIATARLMDVFRTPAGQYRELRTALLCFLVLVQVLPFSSAVFKHFDYDNHRQLELVTLAERLTEPDKDRVYDAVGMVPSRSSLTYFWMFNSMSIHGVRQAQAELREALEQNPPAVVLPNYRLTWLPKEVQAFFDENYLPLATDIKVLGARFPARGWRWRCIHRGRYRFISPEAPGSVIRLDGRTVAPGPIEIEAGPHTIESPVEGFVVWVGPRLDEVPNPGPSPARGADAIGI